MVNIQIAEQFDKEVDTTALEKAALQALAEQDPAEEVNFSVVIDDDQQLHALNHEFLGIDLIHIARGHFLVDTPEHIDALADLQEHVPVRCHHEPAEKEYCCHDARRCDPLFSVLCLRRRLHSIPHHTVCA